MGSKITLLLNVAVLVTNFVVCLGATETQVQVARAAVRTVCAVPCAPRIPPPPAAPPPAAGARLVKCLARLDGLDRLTPAQVEALFLAHDHCRRELAAGGERLLAAAHDGARARAHVEALRARVSRDVAATLKAAQVPDGELLARLVRVVMASAG